MATTDPAQQLNSLSDRQKEVLRLFCKGISYKEIGEKLFITKNTVKAHMGHIYEALELTHLPRRQRVARIFEIYCPLLKKGGSAPKVVENEDNKEPEPISPEVEKMVEEDENALVLWESSQIIDAEVEEVHPRPRRGGGCLLGVLGIIVGLGLMAGYLFFFGGGIPGLGIPVSPPPQPSESVEASPEPQEPAPTSDTPTEIVFTATAIPASETARPSDTSLPTATMVPSSTSEPDTQPGSVLEVGEWWKEDGVWLRLEDYHFTYDIPSIRVFLELWNKTGDTLMFNWNTSGNFSLRDNNGFNYPLNSYFINISQNSIYDPGELKYLHITNSGDYVAFQDDRLFNADVTELILTVTDLSRIDKAQFRIRMNK